MSVPPNQTIYINNLVEKIKKEELKKCLYAIFSQFGKILDVVVMKTYRLRGQAWVVFSDVSAATNALRSMQGFPFFDKPMRITYAKTKSDAVSKVEGKFTEKDREERQRRNAEARVSSGPTDGMVVTSERLMWLADRLASGNGKPAAAPVEAVAPKAQPTGREQVPPNKILFVENLPPATTGSMLSMLFQQFPGYKEVRMVEARPGIAFVEFENDMQASVAMAGLQDFKITPANAIAISFAKQ